MTTTKNNIALDIHNNLVKSTKSTNKTRGRPKKKIVYHNYNYSKNVRYPDRKLQAICVKINPAILSLAYTLINEKNIYFSLSECMRFAGRFLLKNIETNTHYDILFDDSITRTKLKERSIRYTQKMLFYFDTIIDSILYTPVTQSEIIRESLTQYLKHKEYFHTFMENNNISFPTKKLIVIAFKLPEPWINKCKLLVQNKFYKSNSEIYRIACEEFISEFENKDFFLFQHERIIQDDLLCTVSQQSMKVPTGFLHILDKQYEQQKFTDRTQFILIAIKRFLETDNTIYTQFLTDTDTEDIKTTEEKK